MRVVLLKNVSGLGVTGDIKDVADGYAKNYLLPNKMASFANASIVNSVKNFKIKKANETKNELLEAKKIAEKFKGMTLNIKGKVNESGRLYASISNSLVADKLKEVGINVEAKKIILAEHIKEPGEYFVKIKLHPSITSELKISVIA